MDGLERRCCGRTREVALWTDYRGVVVLTVAHVGLDVERQLAHLREAVDGLDVLAGGVAGDSLHLHFVQVFADADDDRVDTGDARLDRFRIVISGCTFASPSVKSTR